MPNDLEIKLGDKVVTLKCDLERLRRVSDYFGGMVPAWKAVTAFELPAYVKIVAAGMGKTLPDEALEASVFEAGMQDLKPSIEKYLNRLINGGRDPVETEVAA